MTSAQVDSTCTQPRVSVIIVNTNELHHLVKCVPTVTKQSYPNYEVLVVDNASTDGSVAYIRQHFPEVRVVDSAVNLGYPGANNLGFQLASGEYFAVLNPDTVVDQHWLEELVRALEANSMAALATSKILLMDEPSIINACGNVVSITGLTFCRGVGEPATAFSQQEEVLAVSGAAFLIRRSTIAEIGPFDADFVAYLEETDLSLRAVLAGYTCLYVPTSKVYHKYTFRFSEKKCFHLEKNRYYMLLKFFSPRTLLLLAPILLFTELLVWGYMIMKGRRYIYQKWLSYLWLWRNRAKIRDGYTRTQRLRRISDRDILERFVPHLLFHQMIQGHLARLLHMLTTPVLSGLSQLSFRFID
jgi:GT2 family glycosyltransferase